MLKVMISRDEYEQALKIVKEYRSQVESVLADAKTQLAEIDINLKGRGIKYKYKGESITKETKICDLPLSTRLCQALSNSRDVLGDITYKEMDIGNFCKISKTDFLRLHNVGKRTLLELEVLCRRAGVLLRD